MAFKIWLRDGILGKEAGQHHTPSHSQSTKRAPCQIWAREYDGKTRCRGRIGTRQGRWRRWTFARCSQKARWTRLNTSKTPFQTPSRQCQLSFSRPRTRQVWQGAHPKSIRARPHNQHVSVQRETYLTSSETLSGSQTRLRMALHPATFARTASPPWAGE